MTSPGLIIGMFEKMIQAIIFDYNGVLANDILIHRESYLRTADELGYPLTTEEAHRYISNAPDEKRTLYFGDISDKKWEEILEVKARYYFEVAEKSSVVFPEVEEVLTSLAKSYTLGLVTNTLRYYFERIFPSRLAETFKEMLFFEDVDEHKPSPVPLLKILDRLGVPIDRSCYVGDSTVDIQMAKTAGVPIITVTTGDNTREELTAAGADYVIGSLKELAPCIQSLAE